MQKKLLEKKIAWKIEKLVLANSRWLSLDKILRAAVFHCKKLLLSSECLSKILCIILLDHNFTLQLNNYLQCSKGLKGLKWKEYVTMREIGNKVKNSKFKACVRYFHQIFIFLPNDSTSKTIKNAFYFI